MNVKKCLLAFPYSCVNVNGQFPRDMLMQVNGNANQQLISFISIMNQCSTLPVVTIISLLFDFSIQLLQCLTILLSWVRFPFRSVTWRNSIQERYPLSSGYGMRLVSRVRIPLLHTKWFISRIYFWQIVLMMFDKTEEKLKRSRGWPFINFEPRTAIQVTPFSHLIQT